MYFEKNLGAALYQSTIGFFEPRGLIGSPLNHEHFESATYVYYLLLASLSQPSPKEPYVLPKFLVGVF